MKEMVRRFLVDESGSATIEYGLLVYCIALAVLSSVNAAGKQAASQLARDSTPLR